MEQATLYGLPVATSESMRDDHIIVVASLAGALAKVAEAAKTTAAHLALLAMGAYWMGWDDQSFAWPNWEDRSTPAWHRLRLEMGR